MLGLAGLALNQASNHGTVEMGHQRSCRWVRADFRFPPTSEEAERDQLPRFSVNYGPRDHVRRTSVDPPIPEGNAATPKTSASCQKRSFASWLQRLRRPTLLRRAPRSNGTRSFACFHGKKVICALGRQHCSFLCHGMGCGSVSSGMTRTGVVHPRTESRVTLKTKSLFS